MLFLCNKSEAIRKYVVGEIFHVGHRKNTLKACLAIFMRAGRLEVRCFKGLKLKFPLLFGGRTGRFMKLARFYMEALPCDGSGISIYLGKLCDSLWNNNKKHSVDQKIANSITECQSSVLFVHRCGLLSHRFPKPS